MWNLELSVHADDTAAVFLRGHVVEEPDSSCGPYWVLKKQSVPHGVSALFERFRFPLLNYSKTDLKAAAEEYGFLDILEESWFCHCPKKGRPCGVCNPCHYAVQEGMEYRLPPIARLKHRVRPLYKAKSKMRRLLSKSIRKATGLQGTIVEVFRG